MLLILLIWPLLGYTLVSQLDNPYFPDRNPSSRFFTNNKRLFKAYKGQRMVIILAFNNVKSALLQINNHDILISPSGPKATIDITPYLKDGNDNTLAVLNIFPPKSNVTAYVPYPTLTYGSPESAGISPKLLNKVDDFIRSDIAKGFPGAALVVVKNGKIIMEKAYGYARKYTDKGQLMERFQDMKLDTMFDLASNTKMFATMLSLMKLHSEGRLNYLDFLGKYIPEYKGVDRKGHDREKISVFDVLTHTAGYSASYAYYSDKSKCYSRAKQNTEKCICQVTDLQRDKGGVPLYSDLDYVLAGLLIEYITKQELQDYVKSAIYAPLKLNRTTFMPLKNGLKKEDAAATEIFGNTRNFTYKFKGVRKTVVQEEVHDALSYHSMNETSGHAGLFSTIHEMAILCQVLLNRGGYDNTKFWTRNTQDLFIKPYDWDSTFGIGWRRQGNEGLKRHFGAYGSNEAFGHTGWTGTVTVIDPKHDLAVILLTNKKHSPCINGQFEGDRFETGNYGSVLQLIYESFLNA